MGFGVDPIKQSVRDIVRCSSEFACLRVRLWAIPFDWPETILETEDRVGVARLQPNVATLLCRTCEPRAVVWMVQSVRVGKYRRVGAIRVVAPVGFEAKQERYGYEEENAKVFLYGGLCVATGLCVVRAAVGDEKERFREHPIHRNRDSIRHPAPRRTKRQTTGMVPNNLCGVQEGANV